MNEEQHVTADQVCAIGQRAAAVQQGASAGLALLDEPQLARIQALADDAQNIIALCAAYRAAAKHLSLLREQLAFHLQVSTSSIPARGRSRASRPSRAKKRR